MSFDNSQMSYIHLVSFPSCWLPPPKTKKLMLVGVDQGTIENLVNDVQDSFPDISLAFYHVPALDWSNQEHVDWLIINQHHMDATFVQVTDWPSLCAAQSFNSVVGAHCQSSLPEVHKFFDKFAPVQATVLQLIHYICKERESSQ